MSRADFTRARPLRESSSNTLNLTPTTPTPTPTANKRRQFGSRVDTDNNISSIESDTPLAISESDEDQDEEEDIRDAPRGGHNPTASAVHGLSLYDEPNKYLTTHRWRGKSMYYYDEGKDVSEQQRRAFEDIASNSAAHISWDLQAKKQTQLWSNFASGLDYNAPHMAKVACRWCGKIIQHPRASPRSRGNLSALKTHIANCPANSAMPPSIEQFCESGLRRASDFSFSSKNLRTAQLDMSVMCNMPFSMAQAPEFLHFIDMVRKSTSNADLSDRKRLAKDLKLEATKARNQLKIDFSRLKSRVSVSLDAWTSPNHHPFLGILVHYIDNEYKICREVLGFEIMTGVHSGANMAHTVWSVLADFGLLDKVGDKQCC